jgi:hypothetical protein
MSLDAMVWAVKDAPVADVEEHAVLTVMADEADEAGCGVLLATGTIAKRARVSTKTAQRRIDDMLARKVLGLGDQTRAAYIRADRRPVVYDLLIPFSAYSKRRIDGVNEARAGKQLPPLTPANRPDIEPPPAPKRRADLGKPRKADGVTSSPPAENDEVTPSTPADGVTTSPPGLVNAHGVTSNSEAKTALPGQTPSRGDYQTPDPIDPVLDPVKNTLPLDDQVTEEGGDAATGEDSPDERTRILTAALDATLARRQGWSRTEVVAAMRAALDADRSVQAVADAILAVANDPASHSPARLNTAGPWWNLGEPTVTGPIKYRDNGAPQCRTHRGEPLDGCGKCKAEAVAAVDDADAPVERLDHAAAMAAIRAATGKGAAKFARPRRRPAAAELAEATS